MMKNLYKQSRGDIMDDLFKVTDEELCRAIKECPVRQMICGTYMCTNDPKGSKTCDSILEGQRCPTINNLIKAKFEPWREDEDN